MKHLAIVGNIGSGKTTLTRRLASHYDWKATFESTDDNPYLSDFYSDMHSWAFHLQIYFLNNRFQQVRHIQESHTPVVQDRTIYEDAHIFASNLHRQGILSDRDFRNYYSMYESIIGAVTPPDLLLYLKADLPRLQQQIRKRGRDYEANMDPSYLEGLNELYAEWITRYDHSPVVVLDMNELDFVQREADFQHVLSQIESFKGGSLTAKV